MIKKLIAFVLCLILLLPTSVMAANNLTWDTNYSRTRATTDEMSQLYNETPIAVSIGDALGTWLYSYSTPIVYGNTLYQYAWNTDSNTGYLVAVDISKVNPQSASDFPVLWAAKFKAEAGERIDGSPGPSISPDGSNMSIAVGKYIYTWPMSVNGSPNVPDSNGFMKQYNKYEIQGNAGQTTNLIAMSPAISKQSYSWQGTDMDTLETTNFNAPVTCAGSWNGGFAAAPLYVPPNIDPGSVIPNGYRTTSINPSWAGEIFTSSPAIQSDGYGDILFGVDGGYPELFVFHPSSMTMGYTGGGAIKYGIASAPVIDSDTGNIYVPDKMGNIYCFNNNGNYMAQNNSLYNGNLIISNLAVDSNYIFAVKSGYSEIHAIDKYTMTDDGTVFSGATGFIDPSVVINPTTKTSLVAVNDANGYVHISAYNSSSGGVFMGSGGLSTSAKGYAPPPYVSVLMDAGPNQLIASWTNDAVAGGENGALEFWVPQVSQLTATVNPEKNQPNATATLNVDTTIDNTMSDVVARLPDANGDPVPITQATEMNYSSKSPGPNGTTIYHWQLPFQVPSNPGTYSVPVELRITAPGSTAAPIDASAPYEVVKPPGGIVSDNGATLTLGSYAMPENRLKQGESFKAWPRDQLSMQHPNGTTYLGDTILADLTVATPKLPDSSDILVSAYLTSATVTRPEGYAQGSQWLSHTIQDPMTITAPLKATLQFEETWGGWQPGKYLAEPPSWAYRAPTLQTPDAPVNIGVDYVVHVIYQYPVLVCSGEACGVVYQTAEMDVPGSTITPIQVYGTDFVVVPVISGSSYTY
ncbi:PQQ-binding-like beta-propeller repeat protein [Desulfosporosinus sp. FKA]|uniref:PQQ-binding-like beta-propeller repeat protein n=1 Tax=Desulfosporosinus sp. FKA TaxID=1969834 RepID=UPI000B4A52D4|nr:PQQ-binding-like beta-propeller repeat protein [Desulfosporosinus sp. FKA]